MRGWLDFEYKTPHSRQRESFILQHIERLLLVDVFAVKSGLDGVFASALRTPKSFEQADSSYQNLLSLKLPYFSKKFKMDSKEMLATDMSELKSLLKQAKQKKLN